MKKLMICLAVLLTGCTSQAAAAMAPAMNRTEKNEVIPESDDFFDSSVNEEQDKTAEPAPAVQPAVPAEPPVTQSPAEDPEPGRTTVSIRQSARMILPSIHPLSMTASRTMRNIRRSNMPRERGSTISVTHPYQRMGHSSNSMAMLIWPWTGKTTW